MLRRLRLKEILLGEHDSRLSRSCPDLHVCKESTKKRRDRKISKSCHSGRLSMFFHYRRTELVEEKDSSSLDFVPWLHQKNKLGGSMEQVTIFSYNKIIISLLFLYSTPVCCVCASFPHCLLCSLTVTISAQCFVFTLSHTQRRFSSLP